MLKKYAILERFRGKKVQWGTLIYDTVSKEHIIEVNRLIIDTISAPMFFDNAIEDGTYLIDKRFSKMWVEMRVCPPGRQNINEILEDMGLAEYDAHEIMISINGKCAMDKMYLEEIH